MTDQSTDIPAGWENILDADETILWQGRPEPGIALAPKHTFIAFFGIAFSSFALFWMVLASQAGGFFWTFGLIHFSAGIGIIVVPIVWPAFMRSRTWYTLTNKKAYIADLVPIKQKRLRTFPISSNTSIDVMTGKFTTINFASEQRRGKNRTYTVPIGFERLTEDDTVHGLFRKIQKDQT